MNIPIFWAKMKEKPFANLITLGKTSLKEKRWGDSYLPKTWWMKKKKKNQNAPMLRIIFDALQLYKSNSAQKTKQQRRSWLGVFSRSPSNKGLRLVYTTVIFLFVCLFNYFLFYFCWLKADNFRTCISRFKGQLSLSLSISEELISSGNLFLLNIQVRFCFNLIRCGLLSVNLFRTKLGL